MFNLLQEKYKIIAPFAIEEVTAKTKIHEYVFVT